MATRTSTIYHIVDHTDLPIRPHVLAKLIQTLNAGDASISKVARIINLDPALSHKCMTMAYQSTEHDHQIIDSVERAIEIIGFDTTKALISQMTAQQAFAPSLENTQKGLSGLWQHAVACAHASKLIAREIAYASPQAAFLAGLIHDIGKLALMVQYPKKYASHMALQNAFSEHGVAQEAAMGIDHASAGSQLMRSWSRHTFMADAVLYHHRSLKEIKHAFPLVQIIYTANLMTAKQTEIRDRGMAAAQELFGFSSQQIAEVNVQIKVKLQESEQFLGLDGPDQADSSSPKNSVGHVQKSIRQAVKNSALLGNVIKHIWAAKNAKVLVHELKQAIWIMFDVKDIMFFLVDAKGQTLVEQVDDYPPMDAIRIPLTLQDCLPVACLLQKEIVDSFTRTSYSELTIMDAQLIGKLARQGMLCVPLLVNTSLVGCILLGIDKVTFPYISKQLKLLETVVQQLAAALYQQQRKEAVDDKKLSEKMAALQTRARKIVHEANNPLGIIKNYLKVLELKMTGQNLECDEIRIINEEITRVGEILKGLTVAESQKTTLTERVDMNEILADMARLLGATFKSRGEFEIHLNLDDNLPKARVSKDIIKQIAINLLKNAAEAMPDGGRIHVMTNYLPAAPETKQNAAVYTGMARIQIRDNGPGLPEGIRSNLFEPHITSKADHQGLGVSVIKNLIDSLNGSIACDSNRNGTTFTIEFPI